jgi:hypothetical protein
MVVKAESTVVKNGGPNNTNRLKRTDREHFVSVLIYGPVYQVVDYNKINEAKIYTYFTFLAIFHNGDVVV